MHLITNGYKRFSKTNSTDTRQRIPLMVYPIHVYSNSIVEMLTSEVLKLSTGVLTLELEPLLKNTTPIF